MIAILCTTLLFVSSTLVVSQYSNKCGIPNTYENRRLDEKYLHILEFNDGDKVTYKCDEGYAQSEGRRDSICSNGRWTLLNMQCKKKKCGSAGDIMNGRFNQEGNLYGDKAFAECNKGYVLQGAPFRQCLDKGWSGTIPTCVESRSTASASDRYRKEVVAKPVTCRKPMAKNAMLNGTVAVYKLGERLLFSCHQGFRMQGASSIVQCSLGGKWSPPPPKCARIKCPALNILNGVVSIGHRVVNTMVTVSCEGAFQLRGAKTITCDASGSWTPAVPTCEPDSVPGQCGQFPFHPNALPKEERLDQYKHGAIVQFQCNHGYVWTGGRDSIYCENGRWTSLELRCESNKCPALNIPNGVISTPHLTINTTVTVSCEGRFQLRGAKDITCDASGSWTPAVPTCEPDSVPGQCGQLPFHPNALPREEQLDQYKHGAIVRFRCSHGYIWTGGRDSIYCKNGLWTSLELRCNKKKCGSAGQLDNGRFDYTGVSFGDTATAECHEGYHLVGEARRHCRAGGWDGRIPVCEVVKCPNPPKVPGAEMFGPTDDEPMRYGHVVSYRCLTGTLDGAPDIYCTKKGTWSAPAPQCRDVACPFPNVPFGSRFAGFRRSYQTNSSVTLTCNPGWRLVGSRTVTCGIDGSWKPALPKCVRP